MTAYVLRRIAFLFPMLFLISVLAFFLVHLIPGDPAVIVAGPYASQDDVDAVREYLGLDKPLLEQYLSYASRLLRGDLGASLRSRRPVVKLLASRIPNTLILAAFGMVIASVVGIAAGVYAAYWRGSLWDNIVMVASLLGLCTPSFWLGLMLMLAFAVKLHWFPTYGFGSPRHIVLPAITLGAASIATIARLSRSAMLEVLLQDYMRTERAKGLAVWKILAKGFRNAVIPVITFIGLQLGVFLSGAVVTERVFTWPGVGSLAVDAILERDLPVVQALVLLFGATFLVINLVVDVSYTFLDPRLRGQIEKE
ncbi:ABC transporter permease [Candidatus Bipolaricaulota bacterium]